MLRWWFVSIVYLGFFYEEINCQCSNAKPCRDIKGGLKENLRQPNVLRSVDGRLDVILTVEMGIFTYNWLTTHRRSYNKTIPGPTWRIKPGDIVTVKLINKLEPSLNITPKPENTKRFPNFTNLHTHGLHISSKEPQDDPFLHIGPGENYTYRYHIVEDHPAGTYWYHAHLHGSVMLQILSGMAGMIIVEDPTTGPFAMDEQLAAISCPDNCQHDIPLIFQPVLQYADVSTFKRGFSQVQASIEDNELFRLLNVVEGNITLAEWMTDVKNGFDYQTTNGQLFPVITITSGQKKRFRMINAGGSKGFSVVITDVNGRTPTSSCQVWEIATDGMYLNAARKPRLGRSFLTPSARVDWIIYCNVPGTYQLRSVFDELDLCSVGYLEAFDDLLATIEVVNLESPPTNLQITLPPRPYYVSDFRNYTSNEMFKDRYTIEASFLNFMNRETFSGPKHYRFKIPVGQVHEWFLVNTDLLDGHPIHMHTNHFQIISYNEYTGPATAYTTDTPFSLVFHDQDGEVCPLQVPSYTGGKFGGFNGTINANGSSPCVYPYFVNHRVHSQTEEPSTTGYVEPGEFRDVITLPPLSNVTVRFYAHKFTGTLVIHCHILNHADGGMMMVVEIVEEDEDTSSNQSAFNDLIGKCSTGPVELANIFMIVVTLFCALFLDLNFL